MSHDIALVIFGAGCGVALCCAILFAGKSARGRGPRRGSMYFDPPPPGTPVPRVPASFLPPSLRSSLQADHIEPATILPRDAEVRAPKGLIPQPYREGTWGAAFFNDPPADWVLELPIAQRVAMEKTLRDKERRGEPIGTAALTEYRRVL